jgi:hypothetical protein
MEFRWFALLISSICLEGLGRKYLPGIPAAVFYFFKDAVLVAGYFLIRPPLEVRQAAKWLYRGFGVWTGAAIAWTVIEVFNPENSSTLLGFIGLRAYWLCWIAPIVVAAALRKANAKRRAIYFLLAMSVSIAVLAAMQFASPPDSSINLYSTVDGEEVYASVATVSATGRARVSGTFSFLSGFAAFTVLVPTLLLSIGLEAKDRSLRRLALAATLACAAVLPMSGSRASVIVGALVLVITSWTAGLLFTRIGRRVVIGAIATVVLATVAFPEALEGVQARFEGGDTEGRLQTIGTILPPVAMASFDYPTMGIGSGMQQNVRSTLGVPPSAYVEEIPAGRCLVELGPIGFLLVWVADLGIMIALIRAGLILKRAGRRAAAGCALSYAFLTFFSNNPFDHISQALFFVGCGFILSEVVDVNAEQARARALQQPVADRR